MRRARLALVTVGLMLASLISLIGPVGNAQNPTKSTQSLSTSLDPSFDVATIKISNPTEGGWGIGTRGNHFWARNATVVDLISFAFEVHAKQIAGGLPWCRTDRFDVEGVPNLKESQFEYSCRQCSAS